jgi:hypothetical protein
MFSDLAQQKLDHTIRFYRPEDWADRCARAGLDKPAGYVTSPVRYTELQATFLADRINSMNPEFPCQVVKMG